MLITSLVGIISSVKETEIDVVFHDPKGFLKDAVIHYFWFINTVNYGQTPTVSIIALLLILTMLPFQGHFEYNFTLPGDYDVEVTAIAYFNAGLKLIPLEGSSRTPVIRLMIIIQMYMVQNPTRPWSRRA